VFIATFLHAIAALVGVDRNGAGKVPFVSAWVVVFLLLTSVGMFISLIQGIGLLQANRMLIFTGDQGRQVITTMYPSVATAATVTELHHFACTALQPYADLSRTASLHTFIGTELRRNSRLPWS